MQTLFTEARRRSLKDVAQIVTPKSINDAKSRLKVIRRYIEKAETKRVSAVKAKNDRDVRRVDKILVKLSAAELHYVRSAVAMRVKDIRKAKRVG